MATIAEFKEHLRNGGKIRRHFWEKGAFIKLIGNTFVCGDGLEYPFTPEDALYCDWEVYKEPFKITHTGFYKAQDGRKVYICYINPSSPVVSGVYEGSEVLLSWYIDGSFDDGKKGHNIVAEWKD